MAIETTGVRPVHQFLLIPVLWQGILASQTVWMCSLVWQTHKTQIVTSFYGLFTNNNKGDFAFHTSVMQMHNIHWLELHLVLKGSFSFFPTHFNNFHLCSLIIQEGLKTFFTSRKKAASLYQHMRDWLWTFYVIVKSQKLISVISPGKQFTRSF